MTKYKPFLNIFKKPTLNIQNSLLLFGNRLKGWKKNIPLTTNSCESFNRHFFDRFDQSHAGIDCFIQKLKETQSSIERNNDLRLSNSTKDFQTKKQIERMQSIKAVCENYSTYYELFYLRTISKLYNWKFD